MADTCIDLGELADFLIFAKGKTYAGDGKKIVMPCGTKQFEPVARGLWRYEDEYKGRSRFGGQVKVFHDDVFLWQMLYYGGILPEFKDDSVLIRKTYSFLKKALLLGDAGCPFRGPETFNYGEFAYFNNTIKGDLSDFKGREEIWVKENNVYVLRFIGGLIE